MTPADWISTDDRLPDDDQTVLIALTARFWTGFHDGDDGWRYVSADPVSGSVTHWMDFPEPPE